MPIATPNKTAMDDDDRRKNEEEEIFLTAKQLGRRWGVNAKTIRDRAQNKEIPSHRLLNMYRFKLKSIEQYEEEHAIIPDKKGD